MSNIQSVLFDKNKFSIEDAVHFLDEHNLNHSKIDVTKNKLRARQVDPIKGDKYRTKKLGDSGIEFIFEYSKKGGKISANSLNKMIKSSYKSRKDADPEIDGYKLDTALSTKKAKVYSKDGKAVVVHRGTTGTLSDWANNAAYLTGLYKYTDRYKKGKESQDAAEKKYGAENIDTTGHSQGAVLARELGKNTKNIITVNPASLFQKKADNETVVRSSLDPVSFLQQHATHTINTGSLNPLTNHSSDILNKLPQETILGSGITVRKVHKSTKYVVKHLGKIISTHKNKDLAHKKAKSLNY